MDLSVFDFEDYRDYLRKVLIPDGAYTQRGPNLSKWSKKLGHKSPSLLSMVLSGQRLPSEDFVESLIHVLKLNKGEADALRLKVKLERLSKKNSSISPELLNEFNLLRERVGKIKSKSYDLSQFESIAQWYVIAIKQLIATPDFFEDSEWISKRLKNKVRPYQVKKAIEHLLHTGAVKRDEAGKLYVDHGIRVGNEVPSEAIVQHHLGMLNQAQEAIRETSVEERSFNGLTFRIDAANVGQVKQDIQNFIQELNAKYSNDISRRVYQINVNLFELTDGTDQSEKKQ